MNTDIDYDARCNLFKASMAKTDAEIEHLRKERLSYERAYIETRIQQHEERWMSLWKTLCTQEGWEVGEKIWWNEEHGIFVCGEYSMNDSRYNVDKAIEAVYEYIERKLVKQVNEYHLQ